MTDLKSRFNPRSDEEISKEQKENDSQLDMTNLSLKDDGANQKDAPASKKSVEKSKNDTKNIDDKETDAEKAADEELRTELIESSYDVQVKLADIQADPNSPLYSVKSFNDLGLSEQLLKGLSMMKFVKPSKIQERALPLLLANPPQNLIGQSQSGTGKTAAFTLTMLSRVDLSVKAPQAICLSPTRELANQSADVARTMAKYTDITIEAIVPIDDEDKRDRRRNNNLAPQITSQVLVCTPGRLLQLVQSKQCDLSHVKVMVLDEADTMLEANMAPQVARLRKLTPIKLQTVLFSATFPEKVESFAKLLVPESNEIRLKQNELNVSGIKQLYMDCDNEGDKLDKLVHLYDVMTIGSSIIFVKTKTTAENLYKEMTKLGHKVSLLHGGLKPQDRDRLMTDYRSGKSKVLITTNVLARGVDVASVSVVVNYDLPVDENDEPDPSTYLHRIGRTGRFGRVGVSISFIHDSKSHDALQAIESYFKGSIKLTQLPTDDWAEVEEIVKKAIKRA